MKFTWVHDASTRSTASQTFLMELCSLPNLLHIFLIIICKTIISHSSSVLTAGMWTCDSIFISCTANRNSQNLHVCTHTKTIKFLAQWSSEFESFSDYWILLPIFTGWLNCTHYVIWQNQTFPLPPFKTIVSTIPLSNIITQWRNVILLLVYSIFNTLPGMSIR